MAQQVNKPLVYLTETRSFRRTDTVFDWLEHIVERTEGLIGKAKSLLLIVMLFLLLTFDILLFAKFMASKW